MTLPVPLGKLIGEAEQVGVAGGGASSLATRTAYMFVASLYSWTVHTVMSSSGSTTVNE